MENFIEGKGLLIHNDLKLRCEAEYKVTINLEELNRGSVIDIFTKISGEVIQNPHEIPYEGYELVINHNNLTYHFKNLFLHSWKEVYLYSFALTFSASKVETENNDIDKLEAYLSNFIIGYDDMSFDNGEIVNNTTIELPFNDKKFKVSMIGDSKFNNTFTNISAQTSFTSTILIKSKEGSLDSNLCHEFLNELNNLVSFAYGSQRLWISSKGYLKENLVFESLRDIYYKDSSINYPIIAVKYSGNLSGFLIQCFETYNKLTQEKKNKLNTLFKLIGDSKSKINLPNSIDEFEKCINYFNSNFESLDIDKKSYSVNSILVSLNKIELFCLKELKYSGKYMSYDKNSYTIKEVLFS
ncbi:MAG: hypothetical protein ACK4IX_02940 [Candidatus Sericytochromatia bacterium]